MDSIKHSKELESKQQLRPSHQLAFEAIGTSWVVDFYEPVTSLKQLEVAIYEQIERFDKAYSRFRSDSLVTVMSKHTGLYTLPDDARPMMELYRQLYDLSGGEVTPLIGAALSEAGYDARYSLRSGKVHVPLAWDKVMDYNHPTLSLKRPVLLDFGAAGKGYLVDQVHALLRSSGVRAYCIDAGGDIWVANQQLSVGLEHPEDPSLVIGVAEIENQSLCGSAGNRRAWGTFNHILSPSKLRSPDHLKAVWAVADTALLADMLTTALYFVPAKILKTIYNFEYVKVYSDITFEMSPNFPGKLFK